MLIPIRNLSDNVLEIVIEPWLEGEVLEPGDVAHLQGDFEDGPEAVIIEIHRDNVMVIHAPLNTAINKVQEK